MENVLLILPHVDIEGTFPFLLVNSLVFYCVYLQAMAMSQILWKNLLKKNCAFFLFIKCFGPSKCPVYLKLL